MKKIFLIIALFMFSGCAGLENVDSIKDDFKKHAREFTRPIKVIDMQQSLDTVDEIIEANPIVLEDEQKLDIQSAMDLLKDFNKTVTYGILIQHLDTVAQESVIVNMMEQTDAQKLHKAISKIKNSQNILSIISALGHTNSLVILMNKHSGTLLETEILPADRALLIYAFTKLLGGL